MIRNSKVSNLSRGHLFYYSLSNIAKSDALLPLGLNLK